MTGIDIVYNWIGPTAPFVNSDVPNVVQVANQYGAPHDRFHFNERIWAPGSYGRHFNLLPSVLVTESYNKPFIFPLQLDWRLHFFSYFSFGQGIIEYSKVNSIILSKIKNGNGFFLVDNSFENWVSDYYLNRMEAYFSESGIPSNKIIYVSGCMNSSEIMEKRNARTGSSLILVGNRIQQQVFVNFNKSHSLPNDSHYLKLPSKLFLVWNRRYRYHRAILALLLDKAGLIDRSYYSMPEIEPFDKATTFRNFCRGNNTAQFNITEQDIDNFCEKLPLAIDHQNNYDSTVAVNSHYIQRSLPYYNNSLVSIITETDYSTEHISFTEKTYKPLYLGHPFIIVGSPGSLKLLRSQGFRTFSDFWDESYDTTEDGVERLKKIAATCEYIGSWSDEKILEFKKQVREILEHNMRVLKVDPTVDIANCIAENIQKQQSRASEVA